MEKDTIISNIMRKSNEAKTAASKLEKECEEAKKKLQEMEQLAQAAVEEEIAQVERVRNEIREICQKNGLYCGVILSPEDIGNIVRIMVEKQENVSIEFNLYFKD